jgi:hypothetical protein
MATFIIKSYHSVSIDNYNEGELETVNNYNLSTEIDAENYKQAIEKYFAETLYYELDFDAVDVVENMLIYDVLVDAENSEASESQIENWKNDEITLYNNHINLYVYELNEIELKF